MLHGLAVLPQDKASVGEGLYIAPRGSTCVFNRMGVQREAMLDVKNVVTGRVFRRADLTPNNDTLPGKREEQ
jgi:hypothetical protein